MRLDLQKTLKELNPYRERQRRLDPLHAALLVIDMRNYFLRIIQPVLEHILQVIQSCHRRNIPIFFTQHGHTEPASDGGALADWWGQVILRGTAERVKNSFLRIRRREPPDFRPGRPFSKPLLRS